MKESTQRVSSADDARRGVLLFFLLYTILVVGTFQDYGISIDEPTQAEYGRHLLDWYCSGFQDRGVLSAPGRTWLYGGLFETLATAAVDLSPLPHYETRHLLNSVIGILGVLAAYRLGVMFGGMPAGLLCALMLILTPRYYGHTFNNPKDLPFAVGYLWSLYCIIRHGQEMPHPSLRTTLLTGLSIGLTLAIRVNGVILFAYWFVASTITLLPTLKSRGLPLRTILQGLAGFGVAYTTMVLFWPWAQVNPLSGPITAIRLFSRFDENHHSLFEGEYIDSLDLPVSYIPTWLLIGLPEAVWIGVIALIVARYRFGRRSQNAGLMSMLVVGFAFPCAYALFNKTPLYDGLRHMLFVIPPLVILSGIGLVSLDRLLVVPRSRLAFRALVVLALSLPAVEMIRLHPFQTSYFNHASGTLDRNWTRYDSDYWMTSYKQGIQWITQNYPVPEGRKLRITGLFPSGVFDQEQSETHLPVLSWQNPDLYLGSVRFHNHLVIPGEPVHIVRAGEAELLYVIRPDSTYAEDPMFEPKRFVDIDRLWVFSRSAPYAEKNGDLPLAIYRYGQYAESAARVDRPDDVIKARAKAAILSIATHGGLEATDDPDQMNALAEEAIRRGEFGLAATILEQLVAGHSDQTSTKNWLVALWGSGQFERGLPLSAKYVETHPNDIDGLALQAMMMQGLGHPDADAFIVRLKALYPNHERIRSL